MRQATEVETLTKTAQEILKGLLYYDIFNYPLNAEEIAKVSSVSEKLEDELSGLVKAGIVKRVDDFYFVGEDFSVVQRRKAGNEEAIRRTAKASRISKRIGSFPFVRGVMVSGSMSKGYMDKDSDIDFFIITEPGRLWVARTLLVAYKKIVLFNSRKNFCVNYFIDSAHMEIQDKNIFTATEAVTLLPFYNGEIYGQFRQMNEWAWKMFPNYAARNTDQCHPHKKRGLKWVGEKLLGGKVGEWLDEKFMQKTIRRWKKKFSHFNEEKLEQAMRSRKNVSKHHPSDFQTRVLIKFEARVREFEGRFNLRLGELNG